MKKNKFLFSQLEEKLMLSVAEPQEETTWIIENEQSIQQQKKNIKEVVIIDAKVQDYNHFLNQISNAEIFILHSEDSVFLTPPPSHKKLKEFLLSFNGSIDNLHIISHSQAANLNLAGHNINLENFSEFKNLFEVLGKSLSKEGNIFFYGCNLASNNQGKELLTKIAETTQADIRASDDLSGSSSLGGDFDLEFNIGDIEGSVVYNDLLLSDYSFVLNAPEISSTSFTINENESFVGSIESSNSPTYSLHYQVNNELEDLSTFTVFATRSLTGGNFNDLIDNDVGYYDDDDDTFPETLEIHKSWRLTPSLFIDFGQIVLLKRFAIASINNDELMTILSSLEPFAEDTDDDGIANNYFTNNNQTIAFGSFNNRNSEFFNKTVIADYIKTRYIEINAKNSIQLEEVYFEGLKLLDNGLFSLTSANGKLVFNDAPDFEKPQDFDRDNTYNIIVKASNNSGSTIKTLDIVIDDVNEAPIFTSAENLTIAENIEKITTILASDKENHILSFSLDNVLDASLFSLNASLGVLSFNDAPDFEDPQDSNKDNTYQIFIKVSDGDNEVKKSFNIIITNLIELSNSSSLDWTIPENFKEVGTIAIEGRDKHSVSYDLLNFSSSLEDLDSFTIFSTKTDNVHHLEYLNDDDPYTGISVNLGLGKSPPTVFLDFGQIVFLKKFSLQTGGDYTKTYSSLSPFAQDNNNNRIADTILTNNNNILLNTYEDGNRAHFNEYVKTRYIKIQTDGHLTIFEVSFEGLYNTALFEINNTDDLLKFKSAPDFEDPQDSNKDNTYSLFISISDRNLNQNIIKSLKIVINDMTNPIFTSPSVFSIQENQRQIASISVIHDETNINLQLLSHTLDNSLFTINNTNKLYFKVAPDFENPNDTNTDNTYKILIKATEKTNKSTTKTFDIVITNKTNPRFTSANSFTITENISFVATIQVNYQGTIYYSLSPNLDNNLFKINNSTGVLTFNTQPDFEKPQDIGTDNTYNVLITTLDDKEITTKSFNIIITNALELSSSVNRFNIPENLRQVGTIAIIEGRDKHSVSYNLFDTFSSSLEVLSSFDALINRQAESGSISNLTDDDSSSSLVVSGTNKDILFIDFGQIVLLKKFVYDSDDINSITIVSSLSAFAIDTNDDDISNIILTNNNIATLYSGDIPSDGVIFNKSDINTYIQTRYLKISSTSLDLNELSFEGFYNKNDLFEINNSTDLLQFKSAPDFEDPQDANSDNTYSLIVLISDRNLNQQLVKSFNIVVIDSPVLSWTIDENISLVGTISVSYQSNISYSLVDSLDSNLFNFNSSTGVLSFLSAPNFEDPQDIGTDNTYNLVININQGLHSLSYTLQVIVLDIMTEGSGGVKVHSLLIEEDLGFLKSLLVNNSFSLSFIPLSSLDPLDSSASSSLLSNFYTKARSSVISGNYSVDDLILLTINLTISSSISEEYLFLIEEKDFELLFEIIPQIKSN